MKEGVDVSITGNSTSPTRFQHLVAGTLQRNGQSRVTVRISPLLPAAHRPYPASGQYGGWPGFLWLDRLYGPLCVAMHSSGFFFCSGARRDDGLDRNGQQPDGWYDCGMYDCRI